MEYDEKTIKDLLIMGVMKCPACGLFSLKSLAINTQTQNKYMHCHSCNKVCPITDENFNNVLIVAKDFPQDENFINHLFEKAYKWFDDNLPDSIKNHNELQKIADEYGEKLYNIIKSEYPDLNNRFLSNTVNFAFDCYIEDWIAAMKKVAEEKENNVVKSNNRELKENADKKHKKTKMKNTHNKKDKQELENKQGKNMHFDIEKIILSDYFQTNLKLMEEDPSYLTHPFEFHCIIAPNENRATFYDEYIDNFNVSPKIESYKYIHRLCMLYQYLEQYKKLYPDYITYRIDKKYKISYSITANEVNIISEKGFGLFGLGKNDDLYAKVLIESFNSALNLFYSFERAYKYNKPLPYGKMIKDFVDNEYYKLGIDFGLAIFVFKNYKYFSKYIEMNDELLNFIHVVKESKNIETLINIIETNYK